MEGGAMRRPSLIYIYGPISAISAIGAISGRVGVQLGGRSIDDGERRRTEERSLP